MLIGAWKAKNGEPLGQAAERQGVQLHRVGGLTMFDDPTLLAGNWCCWLFGEPEDRGELAARFGLGTRSDLPIAFGRALTELGEAACELLCGRFVVVALDRDRDRCLITRDQLGAQPLVYARGGGGVLFAAHECDLLDLLARTPSPDRLALLQWIVGGLTPPGLTLYEGVHRLPAGHRLILDRAGVNVERWWRFRYRDVEEGSTGELAERIREAAFGAIGRDVIARVRDDAPDLSDAIPGHRPKECIDGIDVLDPAAESTIDEYLAELADHIVKKLPVSLLQHDRGGQVAEMDIARCSLCQRPIGIGDHRHCELV